MTTETERLLPCPCRDCDGKVSINEHGDWECAECGYCSDPRDERIADCPLCQSFSYIINDEQICCSGCGLELLHKDAEQAITAWNTRSSPLPPDLETNRLSDMVEIAVLFHETYERLAPQFGYETRADTKAFDPESQNGRLMIATISELVPILRAQRDREIAVWIRDRAKGYPYSGFSLCQAADAIESGQVPPLKGREIDG